MTDLPRVAGLQEGLARQRPLSILQCRPGILQREPPESVSIPQIVLWRNLVDFKVGDGPSESLRTDRLSITMQSILLNQSAMAFAAQFVFCEPLREICWTNEAG